MWRRALHPKDKKLLFTPRHDFFSLDAGALIVSDALEAPATNAKQQNKKQPNRITITNSYYTKPESPINNFSNYTKHNKSTTTHTQHNDKQHPTHTTGSTQSS